MVLSEISIKRPVFATVMSLLLMLVGVIAYDRLSVREYPNIDVPTVSVVTTYTGANASIIESQVTNVLEDSLSGIEGIDYMTSSSSTGESQITINFKLERNADNAASDVRDRVGRVRGRLPDDIDEPIVAKVEANAQPIMYLAFSSPNHTPLEMTDFADRLVKDRLQTAPGVAEVRIFGERRYAMRIWLDKARMAAFGVTTTDISNAIRSQNLEVPSGTIKSENREFTLLAQTDLQTPEEFEQVILRDNDGYLVRVKDVARVRIDAENDRGTVRFKGKTAVAMGVVKQSVANPLDVSSSVREMIPEIEAILPEGMKVNVAYDSSIFIDRSIKAVYSTIAEAVILVILVIFIFLRSLRATLIPLVTIPVSLIGAFVFMYILGYSINTLTLLAMVMAIGLVVDDAIVMLENIYRHIEEGMHPVQAAFKGSKEIGFAVIAMTITLAAVFTPLAFTEGRTGKLFAEFALTLAGAVLVSGFVALTLSPMMCSRILKHENHGKFYLWGEKVLNGLGDLYRRSLKWTMKARPVVLLVGVACLGGLYITFSSLNSELSPVEDRGTIIGFGIGPEGSTTEFLDKYSRQIEGVFSGVPEIERYFVITGLFPTESNVISFAGLKDWEERERSAQEIAGTLGGPMYAGIPGIMSFPITPASLGQSPTARPVEMVVQSTANFEDLQKLIGAVMGKVYASGKLVNPDVDLKLNKPQINLKINRDKAAAIGVSISDVTSTLETLLGGRTITRYKDGNEQYDVIAKVADVDRATPSSLSSIYVRSSSGQMIQLSNLVTLVETVAPKELNHFNKLRAATIKASLTPGLTQGDALVWLRDTIEQTAEEMGIQGIQFDYSGQAREYVESGDSLMITFILALGFIYLVLAAQFESFRSPMVIMLTVPLAILGALLTMKMTGGTLNVYSQIGLITLIGLITKHGILMTEFANQLREEGKEKFEAIVEASVLRLRPILMTTGAMVLGNLPLALATGAGAESRQAIGWVIVGGLTFGTLLTLYVVPTVYTYIVQKLPHMPEPDYE
ncbi:efflux RND transporter permease subunit [Oceanospirillum linum]|uniref:Multidrug transporter AcrB n=1 Tax=Oceanospirillum linum TaxID=966 RepID=A0A1T1HBG4_OCELI|nr:efflux RND transporter permease subunit [Oceanospirillum linum]OOV87100.1 multidrug transporter AcrB [Oceanospirillum linum]SEF74387.1 multidrug efflux pump [Oleiphilus messinensis]SMP16808.1 multidrug efflux pump [Oceanospirillum linum]